MVGSFALAFALVIVGLICTVALPGAGWVLLPILVVAGIVIVVRAIAGERETTRA
jgi:hypothetical protein